MNLFSLQPKTYNLKPTYGFTLVELMISLTLFTVIIVSGISAMVTGQASARTAEAGRLIMDNLNFAIENISRNGRLGYDYTCLYNQDIPTDIANENDLPNGKFAKDCEAGTAIIFKLFNTASGITDLYGYQLAQSVHPRTDKEYTYIEKCVSLDYINTYAFDWQCVPITAPDIDIYNMVFIVKHTNTGGQPNAQIFIDGVSNIEGSQSPFKIQTLLSQRQFKYE